MSKNAEIVWGCAWRWGVLMALLALHFWLGWMCGGGGV